MQTSLEVKLPAETARLPIILDGAEYFVRCAIHENHDEGERSDMLFVELFSKAMRHENAKPGSAAAASPVSIIHMRWPMLLVAALTKLEVDGTLTYRGPPAIIERRAFELAHVVIGKSPQGTRANVLGLELRTLDDELIAMTSKIVVPVRLLKILLNEAEAIA
jgi:hypothetical protein